MEPPPRPSTSLFEVYLRLRPSFAPNAERFLDVEATTHNAPTHITIRPPASDHRKKAVERFAFTRVFEEDAAQLELFKCTGLPSVIEGVLGQPGLEGRDGLLATLGVTGSGKVWSSKKYSSLDTNAFARVTRFSAPKRNVVSHNYLLMSFSKAWDPTLQTCREMIPQSNHCARQMFPRHKY